MKKLLSILLTAAIAITACGCSDSGTSVSDSSVQSSVTESVNVDSSSEGEDRSDAVSEESDVSGSEDEVKQSVKGFQVSGTQLLDANGNPFVFRGINHAHSWFADKDETAINAIAATGANCIRIVLADGEQWTRDSAETIKSLVEMCRQNKMISIVEVHDTTGSDDINSLRRAVDFWIEVKSALVGYEDVVILNIANEWVGKWDSNLWRDGYVEAIPKLREAGIKNTILIDSAGWGQYGKCIADCGKEVFESDPDKNTMFAVHMYGTAGKNKPTIEKNLKGATDQDLCVCVGEFGYNHSDGDVDEAYIMEYCTVNDIGYLGWSWKGNGGGVEYLDISVDWFGATLSSDWGEVLINGANGIKATSKICTVFEQ